jgi:hypothetical protein
MSGGRVAAPRPDPFEEAVMKTNVGGVDRTIRLLAGVGIIAWGVMNGSWWGALGLVPLLTATIGWCPLYLPLGLSTCGVKSKKA